MPPGSGVPDGGGGGSDFTTNPEAMAEKASQWGELSGRADALISGARMNSDFGLVDPVEPSHREVTGSARTWTNAASQEFADLRGKLNAVIGNYADAEDQNSATASGVNRGGGGGAPHAVY